MLRVDGLSVKYGAVPALHGVSLEVNEGELVTLIGANGAGKSTMLKAISGLVKYEGEIIFNGESFDNCGPRNVLTMGIAHCPEGRRVFPQLTVTENLLMGAYLRHDRNEVRRDIDAFFERFPRLGERRLQAAGTLSGGEQQMLAITRTMMSRPKLVLFDEPSLGLAPNLVEQTFRFILDIRAKGTTVLMVEQNAFAALELCDRSYLLASGKLVQHGTSSQMLSNPHIREAYLGG
ncbi:ABC transporter ATP-binding protein [Bradyrhizobium sp. URHD0069]|jgi:branched-chain amino acid transport system ATP-binding protein|uniref:ABC transporter ATP-binding protein n=1 Tax=Bradyrhizobium sp. URHD0069 TaxID=1380355 RepID=UPI000496A20A|nr:ABC transporter ATP-binding protein [Bradyrhizobium sp. URHD0069]